MQADLILDSTVPREACPNNLAPTSSTTAQLVMGDALAIALLECRGFTAEDFARIHPGGMLGKQLYLRVADIYFHNEKPAVSPEADMREIIMEISSKRLGCTAVVENEKLLGIITDGDLRRKLQTTDGVHLKAADFMIKDPVNVEPDALVSEALEKLRRRNITQLLVVENGKYLGVVHLHDILKEGII
jgi:arabinose-5-phosphate isomerase